MCLIIEQGIRRCAVFESRRDRSRARILPLGLRAVQRHGVITDPFRRK